MTSKHQDYWLTIAKAQQAMSARYPGVPPVEIKPVPKETPPKQPSRLKPFWGKARAAAFEWLAENGCPEKGDGGQSRLEAHVADWLAERGYSAGESTIRERVRGWIGEFRALKRTVSAVS